MESSRLVVGYCLAALALAAAAAATDVVSINGVAVDWTQPLFVLPVNVSVEIGRTDEACWNTITIQGQNDGQQRIWGPTNLEGNISCRTAVFHPWLLPHEPESFVVQLDSADQLVRFRFHRQTAAESAASLWIFSFFFIVLLMFVCIGWGFLEETKLRPYYTSVPTCEQQTPAR